MKSTKCTEHDLMCEFTLRIIIEKYKVGKKKFKRRRLFLHGKDPLMALVGRYRQGGKGPNKFFGVGGPTCAPRLK